MKRLVHFSEHVSFFIFNGSFLQGSCKQLKKNETFPCLIPKVLLTLEQLLEGNAWLPMSRKESGGRKGRCQDFEEEWVPSSHRHRDCHGPPNCPLLPRICLSFVGTLMLGSILITSVCMLKHTVFSVSTGIICEDIKHNFLPPLLLKYFSSPF